MFIRDQCLVFLSTWCTDYACHFSLDSSSLGRHNRPNIWKSDKHDDLSTSMTVDMDWHTMTQLRSSRNRSLSPTKACLISISFAETSQRSLPFLLHLVHGVSVSLNARMKPSAQWHPRAHVTDGHVGRSGHEHEGWHGSAQSTGTSCCSHLTKARLRPTRRDHFSWGHLTLKREKTYRERVANSLAAVRWEWAGKTLETFCICDQRRAPRGFYTNAEERFIISVPTLVILRSKVARCQR